MTWSSIAVLIRGSHRKTWVATIKFSPDDCALPCKQKHSIYIGNRQRIPFNEGWVQLAYSRVCFELLNAIRRVNTGGNYSNGSECEL